MPGVTISTAVRTGAVNTGVAPAATFFVVGQTERGTDSEAVRVTSLEDYETKFGGHVSGHFTWYTLKTFFEEGGVTAYVARVTASAAATADIELVSGVSDPGITLTAVGAGTWGNDMTATVTVGSGTFSLVVSYDGSLVYSGAFSSIAEAVTAINFSTSASLYFTAALTTGADGTDLLSAVASASFAGGTDGTVAKSDFTAALDMFGEELGAGAYSCVST